MICLKAWERVNPPGQALVSFTQIKQSNGEPYVDFIAKLHQNLNKISLTTCFARFAEASSCL